MREVVDDLMRDKTTRGRKRIRKLEVLQENESYEKLKRRSHNREEWRLWMPGTCHVTENYEKESTTYRISASTSYPKRR